jgi:N-acetylglutamate synthase/N-acetylornithine aminotransferase
LLQPVVQGRQVKVAGTTRNRAALANASEEFTVLQLAGDLAGVDIHLGGVCLISGGEPAADYTEAAGQAAMSGEEITIRVLLGRGGASERVWTCDLSYDYVRINAEYRT